jgi:glucokinase
VRVREPCVMGVDLGASNVRVGLGTRDGCILAKACQKTDTRHGPEGIAAQIIGMIQGLIPDAKRPLGGIGIGSIGPLDLMRGRVTQSPNIPFASVPLRDPITRAFNTPITLLNDCNAAVVGEHWFGAGKGVDHLVYITLSTGIGGGALVDGHLLSGKDGNAVEVGHMVIDVEGRLRCGCGKRGHWEAYCSGRNIPNYVRMRLKETVFQESSLRRRMSGWSPEETTQRLFEEAERGDPEALAMVEGIGRLNAAGFATVINVYDPALITVGGALALKHERLILPPIQKYLRKYVINRVPKIRITPLGDDAVLLGAIAAASHPNALAR